ncbi:MFS transporter [Leptolyngbya sp. GB1-A1]|uniref:MFS transporter n=1 Tax=Leptolyngbya sp. GB1-A1 TaxID=2933908 RepID=UPI00329738A6
MVHSFTVMESWGRLSWIAQVPVDPNLARPEQTSVLFSGPQFFVALISGILLAFAIQLVLTNLSVAAGISILGRSTDPDHQSSRSSHHDDDHDSGVGSTIRKIGFGVGLWTLISVSLALFIACYLAVQLSLLTSSGLGAIVGLVIWAAYFSLLVWFSSTTVGSMVGSVVQAATSGFQSVFNTATAAIGGQMAKRQAVSTAEAVASAVRNEIGSAIDPSQIRQSIEDYVHRLNLPNYDLTKVRRDFESLLDDPEVQALADNNRLSQIDRQTFVDLVSRRTDFSPQEVNRFADLLEGTWRQTLGKRQRRDQMSELTSYLQSTQPGQLQIDELNRKIDRLADELRQAQTNNTTLAANVTNAVNAASSAASSAADAANNAASTAGTASTGSNAGASQGMMQQTAMTGLNTLIGLVMGRTDLSDINVSQIVDRLKSASGTVSEQTSKAVSQVKGDNQPSPIRTDVEHYLLNTYSWQMTPERLDREFREVLYDPAADPDAVIDQVSRLNRALFVQLLSSRGVFTPSRVEEIADQLERIRQEVITTARAEKEREVTTDLQQRIEIYLTLTPKEQLFSNSTLPAFYAILHNAEAEYETTSVRLAPFSRDALRQMLMQRQDLTPEETETILNALEATRNQALEESRSLDQQAKERLTTLRDRFANYLSSTGKAELSPEGIQRDLQLLLNDPQTGISSLRNRLGHFDRDTVVQLLRQRQDLTDDEANRIVGQVESNWNSVVHAPQTAVDTVKDRTNQTIETLAQYLRNTNKEALNPEGIQRDLQTLLNDPKEGSLALRRRLASIDRDTLVQLLSQRQDLSSDQVNRTIDQVQNSIAQIRRSPRRLALRTQQQVMGFESMLEDYLRNTNKEELNPEGIKRDLQTLLNDPRAGMYQLGDRLSRFDRSTLIALMSQRQDISREEAERIVDQVNSTLMQFLDQIRQVQYRIQSVIDNILDRIRSYLNSLDRPELNYEGIKRDVLQLFDDPQAGFDALRDRLSHFDRGTMMAILGSRADIPNEYAHRIVDQIESARVGVLQRAERVQMEAQRRVETVKYQAQRQLDETRKAAATAAWWLFFTAVVSAVTAAIGGSIAAS